MSNLRKWTGGWTNRGTVLTTELNSLADTGISVLGTAYDNTTNGNQLGWLEVSLASLTPTAGASLTAWIAQALDGTNYEDGPASANPGTGMQNVTASVKSGVGAKRLTIGPFLLPPGKMKVAVQNACGVALAASGNTVTLYTTDETLNG